MEQTLPYSTLENDEYAIMSEISMLMDEYCNGSGGVREVVDRFEVDGLIHAANEPYARGSVFATLGTESVQLMQLLVPRYEALDDYNKDTAIIIAEADKAIETAVQVVVAAKLFEKVTAEINGPTGLSDATCSNLARYNPGNQEAVLGITHQLYAKNIADHKAGENARILQHNGEAFGHIGGDSLVTVPDAKGGVKSISLDEYKILLLMNERRDLKKQLAKRSDPDLIASLRAVEAIPEHAYQQRLEDTNVPTRLGTSLSTVGRGVQVASSHVAKTAHKTSHRMGSIDHTRVVSVALVGVTAGAIGLTVVKPGRADAATIAQTTASLRLANNDRANLLAQPAVSAVDGGLVVGASPTEQAPAVVPQSQEIGNGGVTVSEDAALALPPNPQPDHSIMPIQNEAVRSAVANAGANGRIVDGALALARATVGNNAQMPTATPVLRTIESINTTLSNSSTVPPEIVGVVRNMLIVSAATLADPNVLNSISAEQWNIIKGGQDSVATQNTISRLTAKHLASLAQPDSGQNSASTSDHKEQLAVLLASSEYYAAYDPTPPPDNGTRRLATPPSNSTPAPTHHNLSPPKSSHHPSQAPKTPELPAGLPASAKIVTPGIVSQMLPNATQRTINKNYGLVLKGLASLGIADPTMELYGFATINVETGSFEPIPEWGRGGGRYRTPTGDYYGRGFIQLTWESNYRAAGEAIGIDLINNPDLALRPDIAAKIFAWYLAEGNHQERIRNALKVGDLAAARAVVNGGTNGLQGFSDSYNTGLKAVQALHHPDAAPATPPPTPTPTPPATPPDAAPATPPPEVPVVPTDNNGGLVVPSAPVTQADSNGSTETNPTPPAVDSPPQSITPAPVAPAAPTPPAQAEKPNAAFETSGHTHETIKDYRVPENVGSGSSQVTYYSQHDKRWADNAYTINPGSGQTFSTSACGPTSEAIVLSTILGREILPTETAAYDISHGYRTPNNGTSFASMSAIANDYGVPETPLAKDTGALKDFFNHGGKRLVIVNGQDNNPSTPATEAGHFYVIRGITADGRLLVADPNRLDTTLKSWDPSQILDPATVVFGYSAKS
jgi:putative chitinase